jgi:nitrate/TMAO reductase-like tetraheme cytochrome c subunit
MTSSTGPSAPAPRRPGTRTFVRDAWIAVGVFAFLLWLGVGAFYLSGSSTVCQSCHEMTPKVNAWKTSSHADIGCPACHEVQRAYYSFPEILGARAAAMQRDLHAHNSQSTADIVAALDTMTPSISDANCLKCHDLSRKITVHFGTIINHAEHARRNGSCISCHYWTAHPPPNADRPVLLMARCFTCHGRTPGAKAPGTCTTCHPKSFDLRPQSHLTGDWLALHGKVALAVRQQCVMCHETTFCDNCHKLPMPHPATWVRGNPGHSTVGAKSPQICAQCHTGTPDLCSMCHHQGSTPAATPWIVQHPTMVSKKGAAFCMGCHVAVFCYNCHTARRVAGNVPGS